VQIHASMIGIYQILSYHQVHTSPTAEYIYPEVMVAPVSRADRNCAALRGKSVVVKYNWTQKVLSLGGYLLRSPRSPYGFELDRCLGSCKTSPRHLGTGAGTRAAFLLRPKRGVLS